MKLKSRFVCRDRRELAISTRGIWSPTVTQWRDVIEDYIYISRKRKENKFSMFKLQLQLIMDIIDCVKLIDQYNTILSEKRKEKEAGNTSEEIEEEIDGLEREIRANDLVIAALRDVADGIVWRLFNYNRAILYLLADKQASGPLRPDSGFLHNLYELTDVFLNEDSIAVLNDITNFLRVGDVTTVNSDGSIELIEVKGTRRKRGGRISRQKEKMEEIVNFVNTGVAEYDGKSFKIIDSNTRLRNHLGILRNVIPKTKSRGYNSELIGNYLIIECADFRKIQNADSLITYLESRHKGVKDQWEKNNDFLIDHWAIEKVQGSKNLAPYSVFPFSEEICTDILCGRMMIHYIINYTEIYRIFEKHGWHVVDTLFQKIENLTKLKGVDAIRREDFVNEPFVTVKKGPLTCAIPPGMLGRIAYELLSPKAIIDELEKTLAEGPKDYDLELINFIHDKDIWL